MKRIITSVFALAIFATSCAGSAENQESTTTATHEEVVHQESEDAQENIGEAETENEELLNYEGSDEDDDRFDNLCTDETVSDCYIVDSFQYMDATYITVDFVNYKVIETADGHEVELVNVIKTLRTMLVEDEYDDCSGEHSESTVEMLATAKENPFTLFRLESNEGIVSVLFEKRCDE